jgi:prepilin-type N-terminal cleavage/methylation domain-containing protein
MLNFNHKAFTLIELLVVITIIGVLASIVMVSMSGGTDKAKNARGLANRRSAGLYCAINPGASTLNGSRIYCDENNTMWSETLSGIKQWKTSDTALPSYTSGDCNNLTATDMEDYPACNACRNLDYAGFSEGWRLPTQGSGSIASARDGTYCATGRQLWGLGEETCNWNPSLCDSSQTSCSPAYDSSAVASYYWSSIEYTGSNAWYVKFDNGYVCAPSKTNSAYVRCVLGQ